MLVNRLGRRIFHASCILIANRWPYSAKDLVDDGAATIEYLVRQGVDSKRIMLYGHSLGGGVVGELAAWRYPDVTRVHDRSFMYDNRCIPAFFLIIAAL